MGNGASAINSSHCAFADDDVSIDSRCEEKFIMTAVYPHLKSYTWEDPSTEDLLISDHVRSGLNTIPLLLQFDETFYGILEKTGLSFPTKSFCFKKQFLKELLSFITDPAEKNPDLYEFQSKLFVKRYSFEDIAIEDCKLPSPCILFILVVASHSLPLITFTHRWPAGRGLSADDVPHGRVGRAAVGPFIFPLRAGHPLKAAAPTIPTQFCFQPFLF